MSNFSTFDFHISTLVYLENACIKIVIIIMIIIYRWKVKEEDEMTTSRAGPVLASLSHKGHLNLKVISGAQTIDKVTGQKLNEVI